MNTLCQLLGIQHPILQAPMAGAQDSAMALAVSQAGGLGALPSAALGLDALRLHLDVLAQSGLPYQLNAFCHAPPVPDAAALADWHARLAPYCAEFGLDPADLPDGPGRQPFGPVLLDLVEACRPPVLSFHFGLPEPELLQRVRATGAKVLASATTVAEALWLQERGVDAIIAQGVEAGGHRGFFLGHDTRTQMGTLALVPQIVRAVRVPVIAAGGISTAEGVAAAFALGASGVQAGTAYLLCPESLVSPLHRAALQAEADPARAAGTALTTVFTGGAARGILNRAMRELGTLDNGAPAFPLASAAITALRRAAEAGGSTDFTPLWCGQNPSGCRPVGAAEITRALAAGVPG